MKENQLHLYILNDVLYDYTPGMAVIAAENIDQCREIYLTEFNSDEYNREGYLAEFENATVTVINSVGLDEPGVVSYVYGGG